MVARLPNQMREEVFADPNMYDDSTFESPADFGFDDSTGALSGFTAVDGQRMRPATGGLRIDEPYPAGSSTFTAGLTSSIDPSDVWADSRLSQPNAFNPVNGVGGPSVQELIGGRAKNVTHRFGQITPPDDSPPEIDQRKDSATSVESSRSKKMDKSERARNAANQRHNKSKKARNESQDMDGEESEGSADGKREKYREKNRVAAAKCRAKKKLNVDVLEDRHRTLNAENTALRFQERQLRDELSHLRTLALSHTPASNDCGCHSIHMYNSQKASQLAYGLGTQGSSPASATASNVQSPIMADIISRTNFLTGGQPAPSAAFYPRRASSFAMPSGFDFAPVSDADQMRTSSKSIDGGDAFASFLHNSPDARAGFS